MKSKTLKHFTLIAFIIVLACLPWATNNYQQYIINVVFVNFLVTLGLGIILGYSGQFAFASAGFLGVGAYTAGLSMVRYGIPYLPALALSGVVTLIIAILLSFVGLRLKRYYLAITTMAFTLCMRFFYVNAVKITYGPSGFNIPAANIVGIKLDTDHRVYYMVLFFVLLFSILARNALRSKIGRAFMAIRDNEDAAAASSINVKEYKMLAFGICGVLGGVAGGLYTQVLGRITPDEFAMLPIMLHFVIVVLGGLGSFFGLIISTIIVTIIPELIRAFGELQEVVYGAIIVLIILVAPGGLYGLVLKYSPIKWREKLYGNVE
jgi:branched-chain amino acid transport system permease protein